VQRKIRSFNLELFLKPPASREQGHAQACVKNHYQTNKPKQHSAAKRSVSADGWVRRSIRAYSTVACLRGPVNGGAEKEKGRELPEKGLYELSFLIH
jgi:hypothetical protein